MIGVYCCIDIAGQVLYVGASRNVEKRITQHRAKAWWPMVTLIEVYEQSDWTTALRVERGLLREFSPEFNVQSVDPVDQAVHGIFAPMFRDLAEVCSP